MRHAAFGLVLLLSMLGCSGGGADCCGPPPDPDPDPDPVPGAVALVSIVDGRDQRAEVGKELPEAVVVRASDAQAFAVPDQLINFVVVSGGGSVFAGAAQTNDLGEARERWTLGTTAGEQVLEARAVDQTTGDPIVFARIAATAEPGPAATLKLFREDRGHFIEKFAEHRMFLGESFDVASLLVEVADQYGNKIADPPELTVQPSAAFSTSGTTISSPIEIHDTVTVASGAATDSVFVTVLRDMAGFTGGTGGYACNGRKLIHFTADDAYVTREAATFVIDSVRTTDVVTFYVTGTTTWTLEGGEVRTFPTKDGIRASQRVGELFWHTPMRGISTYQGDNPLSYSGGDQCPGWTGWSSNTVVEPLTITAR